MSEVEQCWVIQRDDGKFYAGWNFDRNGEAKEYFSNTEITNIIKTKAEAEHYLKHANISRTETLPFLTWEEFLEKKAIHFIDNKGIDFVLRITDNKIKLMVFFMVSKTWDLTEENFYKAYDECKKLFLGENND